MSRGQIETFVVVQPSDDAGWEGIGKPRKTLSRVITSLNSDEDSSEPVIWAFFMLFVMFPAIKEKLLSDEDSWRRERAITKGRDRRTPFPFLTYFFYK